MSRIRVWSKLTYYDPRSVLLGLNSIAAEYPLEKYPEKVRDLRTRDLRSFGESRQCAIFCFGMHEIFDLDVSYANSEESDYDFVACYRDGDTNNFVPIQMKEFVPEDIDPKAVLEREISKLSKYADSRDLCVAIHLNRATRINFNDVAVPELNIRELWLFGATSPDLDRWILVNLLQERRIFEFRYPRN